MTAWLKRMAKIVSYIIILMMAIAALTFLLTPLFSYLLNKERGFFEKRASTYLAMPVNIHDVSFSWYRCHPAITLNKVTLRQQESQKAALEVQKINVFFSISKSLWQHTIVPTGIIVTGTTVKIKETKAGEWQIEGFPPFSNGSNNDSKLRNIFGFLLIKPYLELRQVHLEYEQLNGQKYEVTIPALTLKNSASHHIIQGSTILKQKIPTEVSFSLGFEGEKWIAAQDNKAAIMIPPSSPSNINALKYWVDLSQLKANGYIYITGLSLPQWLKEKEWKGWQIKEGIASAKIWGTWNRGKFRKLQSFVKLYDLNLYSLNNHTTHAIKRLSTNISFKHENKKYILSAEDILIDLPNKLWPVTHFYLSFSRDKEGRLSETTANIGYIDLAYIDSYLNASPALFPETLQQTLKGLQLKGSIQNTILTFKGEFKDWQHTVFETQFNQLSFLPWQSRPGVKNLSGKIKWDGKQGELSLNSNQLELQYDSIFANKLRFEELSGNIPFQKNENNKWVFTIPSLQILNSDFAANLNGSFTIPAAGSILTDLKANFVLQNASHVSYYLPLRLFSEPLTKWLQSAFLSGEIKEGHAELRGPLNEFPFDHQNGSFTISGKVNNIDLHYAPDWPLLKQVSGKIAFTGRQVLIDVDNAAIQGIPVARVRGIIPSIGGEKPALLYVSAKNIKTDFNHGLAFLHESPLEKTIGKMFANVTLSGAADLDLNLTVPLGDPSKTKVRGALHFNDAELNALPWEINLRQLSGAVFFTEDKIEANTINSFLFDKPFTFSLATLNKTKELSFVRAAFQTNLDVSRLETWLKLPLSEFASGAAKVNGEIDLSEKMPMEVSLRSDLVGIKINLPDEYGKSAEVSRPFTANLILPEKPPLRLKLGYGELLNTAVIFDRKADKYHLLGMNLHAGPGQVMWPEGEGLRITAKMTKLEWDQIKKYMNDSNKSNFLNLAFRSADIEAQTFNLFGQELKQVHLKVDSTANDWDINITSTNIVGRIKLPLHITPASLLTAQFQKFYLNDVNKKLETEFNIASLPSISFIATSMKYGEISLGEVEFKGVRNGNNMNIQSLRMLSPQGTLQAAGTWEKGDHTNRTHLKGRIVSSRVSQLLGNLGFAVQHFIFSTGQLDFNLSWQDAPYAPSFTQLNGQAKLFLGPGRIENVGNDAQMGLGRILSLFSLQSIPRRLSLNFSDIFEKGYSFDSLQGDFTFRDGNAYTRNLRLSGPIASVDVDGRIGLTNKDYHLMLNVKTYVTSGLPVAATLFTANPLIVLGAFAVNSVIGPEVASYHYLVTGTWEKPMWRSVEGGK